MAAPNGRGSWNIIGKFVLAALACLTVAACAEPDDLNANQQAGTINAADYSAFYLWTGVPAPAAMDDAQAVYLLWGELRIDDPSRIVPLRRAAPTAIVDEKWLVVRAERLDWQEAAYTQLTREADRWNRHGGLTGVQVDFDSSTDELGDYAKFLRDIRLRLPEGLKLSATGLMDWPANAPRQELDAMRDALDEIVIQTYRETVTIQDYRRYLAATERLDMPYKVALVEGGEWEAPAQLASDPDFRGFIVFLLGEKHKKVRK
ncbi:DUF3142 domain-containing protein [Pontixanthobacter gangjinensis]|uniref:DUF3142 domain-containing protein n=1 Tax=Pontixanthobacter gangjinensis TaxID=1028742 RepID=A0A6I4SPL1_9SPHN|nr:DUF3142 domain-containing protein [Pontixanthobacter gangjinensis]MXO57714.1 DUF3142 domain-containing protein [Pontixanthobacter gangjinensis]